jgi:hypothetical protein
MRLRTASESVGWLNTEGPLTVSPNFRDRADCGCWLKTLPDGQVDQLVCAAHHAKTMAHLNHQLTSAGPDTLATAAPKA